MKFENILAIIPCRAGSQRFPGKNTAMFNGLPLVVYKVKQAMAMGFIKTNIVVTTDSYTVKDAVKNEPVLIIDRAHNLCTSEISQEDVVEDAIIRAEEAGIEFDTVCVLQVTSPILAVESLVDALTKYQKSTCKSMISVTEAYQPSGGFYIVDKDLFLEYQSFYQEGGFVYVLPPDECLDIDFRYQMEIAKCIFNDHVFSQKDRE